MKIVINKGIIVSDNLSKITDGSYEIKKSVNNRSEGQNKYIHGYLFPNCARIMSEHLSIKISTEMAKEILKQRCAKEYIEKIDEWIVIPTSKMTTVQMMKFIEKVLKYIATKYGEYLDEPDIRNIVLNNY